MYPQETHTPYCYTPLKGGISMLERSRLTGALLGQVEDILHLFHRLVCHTFRF